MHTELLQTDAASHASELLVVFAADIATGSGDQSQPRLLVDDMAFEPATEFALASGEFKAEENELLLLHSPQGLSAMRLLIVGVGKRAKVTPHVLGRAAGAAVRAAKQRSLRSLAVVFPSTEFQTADVARAIAYSAQLADFDPDTYRSDRKDRSIQNFSLVLSFSVDREAGEAGFREGNILGESQNFTRSLVNEPGNRLTPTMLGQRAAAMCHENGISCIVYGADKLRELKMGAFWSVAKGSDEPPALIVMRYEPEDAVQGPVVGLVGKGITFDTGGISIKPADKMEMMKYDMAGAGAMIGAMLAIAKLKPKVRVIGVVCAAENMPSGKAQKPGDVQISMSGKSIEVINTDAEGRLVLADGLAYAKQLGATHLIDAATLTGACVVALGKIRAGGFTNDDETWKRFEDATEVSGEKFWRLPLDDEYRELLRSEIADIKNTGGRWGGASTAAMFLKEFVGDTPWVHLDIAGCAWIEDKRPDIATGPSGVGVPSIAGWVRSFAAPEPEPEPEPSAPDFSGSDFS
jgi:leucyl aminopeptidase